MRRSEWFGCCGCSSGVVSTRSATTQPLSARDNALPLEHTTTKVPPEIESLDLNVAAARSKRSCVQPTILEADVEPDDHGRSDDKAKLGGSRLHIDPSADEGDAAATAAKNCAKAVNVLHKRHAIAFLYMQFGQPEQAIWMGLNGTIEAIQQALRIKNTSRNIIRRVLLDVQDSVMNGVDYTGRDGRPPIVTIESETGKLAEEYAETGYKLEWMTDLVNHHCQQKQLPAVTQSAVYSCVQRIKARKGAGKLTTES